MVEVDLLDFVTECRRLAKQALGSRAGEPATGGFDRWVHVVIHCIRLEEQHTYRETANRLRYMSDIRAALGLDDEGVPEFTTIYKAFDRFEMWVWRALLRCSASEHGPSGAVALDSTFFERGHASAYYRKRAGRSVETLKATTLTDTESLAVLDVHCSARWDHDTQTGRRLVRRNRGVLASVAADKAFHDWQLLMDCRAHGIEPLILRRGSTVASVGHNAAIRTRGYDKRWLAETTYSTTKRALGSALRARSWYREFREVVLMFAVTNIERLCDPL